jgi:hypothetical protein
MFRKILITAKRKRCKRKRERAARRAAGAASPNFYYHCGINPAFVIPPVGDAE